MEYRIKEVNHKFELQQRDGPGKHFKIPHHSKSHSTYATRAEAEEALADVLRLQSLTDEELFAACPFN